MTTGTRAVSRRHRQIPVATAGVTAGSFPPASLASGRGKLTLALLCAVAFLALAAVSVVNIALPSIRRDLHMPVQNLQWILSGYLLTFGGFMLLGGRSVDPDDDVRRWHRQAQGARRLGGGGRACLGWSAPRRPARSGTWLALGFFGVPAHLRARPRRD